MNQKLKAKIIENYGSQFRFAHALGTHETEISAVVRGRKTLEPDKLREWARLLNCNVEDVFPVEV
jgi:plasmid maintenance system antidote protein VapI